MRVRHKITGQEMTIKKVHGSVATCRLDTAKVLRYECGKPYMTIDVAVCRMDNLETI